MREMREVRGPWTPLCLGFCAWQDTEGLHPWVLHVASGSACHLLTLQRGAGKHGSAGAVPLFWAVLLQLV